MLRAILSTLLRPNVALATGLVVLSGLSFGTMPFFTKRLADSGMPAYAIEIYRYGLTALILFPVLLANIREKAAIAWGLSAGFVMGFGWFGYVWALEEAPVASVSLLYMSYPAFTVLMGWGFFGDKPPKAAAFAAVLVLLGSALALSPSQFQAGHVPVLLASLSAPLGFGFMINVLIHKVGHLPPLARIASIALGAVLGLSPLAIFSDPQLMVPQTENGWWLVAGIALITALLPQLLFYTYAPHIGAARTSMAASVELPTNFIVGWIAFSEAIGGGLWAACLLILAAILITPANPHPKHARTDAPPDR
ncbi:DMT family transporter [Nitratireductor sp. XY-223]|uniref:DMT family transporter n=1 Tax=Nitratireductor sp. XY-223 TaxID=2561926 RepID=UPI00145B9F37|nr:DMT family transporter [Nitratireductor sp. XY-223]